MADHDRANAKPDPVVLQGRVAHLTAKVGDLGLMALRTAAFLRLFKDEYGEPDE